MRIAQNVLILEEMRLFFTYIVTFLEAPIANELPAMTPCTIYVRMIHARDVGWVRMVAAHRNEYFTVGMFC